MGFDPVSSLPLSSERDRQTDAVHVIPDHRYDSADIGIRSSGFKGDDDDDGDDGGDGFVHKTHEAIQPGGLAQHYEGPFILFVQNL